MLQCISPYHILAFLDGSAVLFFAETLCVNYRVSGKSARKVEVKVVVVNFGEGGLSFYFLSFQFVCDCVCVPSPFPLCVISVHFYMSVLSYSINNIVY